MQNDGFNQVLFVERLEQILIRTNQFAAGAIKQRVFAGQHDDWCAFELLVFFDKRTGLIAIKAWHHHVNKNNIRLVINYFGQAVKSIFGKNDLAPRLGQKYLAAPPDRVAVVNQQHLNS